MQPPSSTGIMGAILASIVPRNARRRIHQEDVVDLTSTAPTRRPLFGVQSAARKTTGSSATATLLHTPLKTLLSSVDFTTPTNPNAS